MDAPIVILPGLICGPEMFADVMAAFPRSQAIGGFYGGADRLEGMAAHALAHMPESSIVVGHSMGARVALEIWRIAPDRVAGLALCDTGVHPVRPGEREKRHELRDLGRENGFEALVDRWLPPMIGPRSRGDADLCASLKAMCMRAGQAVFEAQIEALLNRRDGHEMLSTITCPTAVVVGSDDEWSPVDQHEAITHAVRGSTLTVIPGAGHMAPAEDPAAFTAALRPLTCKG